MKDIVKPLLDWKEKGRKAALVTVLQTWGSSPRQAGAHMAVNEDMEFVGSVSGGCIETAVIQESLEVIHSEISKRIKYGVSDESAWEVGLACGGEIEVFITNINWPEIAPILDAINSKEPVWYQVTLDTAGKISSFQDNTYPKTSPFIQTDPTPGKIILYSPPDSKLIIIGGVNISQHLIDFSKLLGYKTTIIDPRKGFANQQRFPNAEKIINLWPDEAFKKISITNNTAIVILTHDDKIDIPAMKLALESPAFYVGALGSKKTQARRKDELLSLGIPQEKLNQIHGPIGIDIGAKNPIEIALAIIAEIASVANAAVTT